VFSLHATAPRPAKTNNEQSESRMASSGLQVGRGERTRHADT